MNDKVRKILGGMSTASLIVAGSLPLLATTCIYDPPTTCTKAKTRKVESSKGDKKKGNAAAKEKVQKSAPAKTAPAKAKTSK